MALIPKPGDPPPLPIQLIVRLAVCIGIAYLGWIKLGPIGLVISAPLFGLALAWPIMRLASGSVRWIRARAMHDLQGRHFVHRGHTLLIDTDDDGHCWLDAQEVRLAGVQLPSDGVLLRRFADDELQQPVRDRGLLLRADALLRHLQGSSSPDTHRFSIWLARMVIAPAQRAHQRRFHRRP